MNHPTRENICPEVLITFRLRALSQRCSDHLDAVCSDEGLTGKQWSVLIAICLGQSNCAMLSRELVHDKGAMTRLVDTLEDKRLVRREHDLDDRRFINLSPTEEGIAVAMRCRERVICLWNTLLAEWSAEEVASLIGNLKRLHRTLKVS